MEVQKVDIEQLIASKNPKLLKKLPRFVLRYLKRILHQDEVNYLLETYHDQIGLDFVNALLQHLNVTYTVHGQENIPTEGRFLFVSNHPLGGFDGVVLMSAIGKKFPKVKFVVNDLLMNLRQLKPLFLPVNKHGMQNHEYLQQLRNAYSSDNQILYFPAGLCSRKIKGKITDLPWKNSVLKISREHQRDIIPIFFEGRNSKFFYNLGSLRTFCGIKANLEMLYLSDELFKQRNRHFDVHIGAPISYDLVAQAAKPQEMLNFVREKVYELNPRRK